MHRSHIEGIRKRKPYIDTYNYIQDKGIIFSFIYKGFRAFPGFSMHPRMHTDALHTKQAGKLYNIVKVGGEDFTMCKVRPRDAVAPPAHQDAFSVRGRSDAANVLSEGTVSQGGGESSGQFWFSVLSFQRVNGAPPPCPRSSWATRDVAPSSEWQAVPGSRGACIGWTLARGC